MYPFSPFSFVTLSLFLRILFKAYEIGFCSFHFSFVTLSYFHRKLFKEYDLMDTSYATG